MLAHVLALEFPPVSHPIRWTDFWLKENKSLAINKVVLERWLSAIFVCAFYFTAARPNAPVPPCL